MSERRPRVTERSQEFAARGRPLPADGARVVAARDQSCGARGKRRAPARLRGEVTVGEGFEPPVGSSPTAVFKTAAIGRSAIPPRMDAAATRCRVGIDALAGRRG